MKIGIYGCRNLLSKDIESIHQIKNDEMASVHLAVFCSRISPLDEWQIIKLGEIDIGTGEIFTTRHEIVGFDTRRLKEPVSDQ